MSQPPGGNAADMLDGDRRHSLRDVTFKPDTSSERWLKLNTSMRERGVGCQEPDAYHPDVEAAGSRERAYENRRVVTGEPGRI